MRIHRLRIRYRLAPGKRLHLGGVRQLVAQRLRIRPTLGVHTVDGTTPLS